ncbi:MAG: hypothetical protein CMB80_01865 [Flammeovirgaceae bacterium]|nr:hypothetical protein [Flammeovirgaceae bacterium]|tara:strand:+ start:356 stop:724 length:369 start_codon:yes stop_codon:yes gene_type:complete
MLDLKEQKKRILEKALQTLFCCQKCGVVTLKEYEFQHDMKGYSLRVCEDCKNLLEILVEPDHECSWESIVWENRNEIPFYYVAGCGETLERNGRCKCGKTFREVYLHSCVIDEQTNSMTSLV